MLGVAGWEFLMISSKKDVPESIAPLLALFACLVCLLGCFQMKAHDATTASDSTGTIAGQLHGEFVHGFNPFYGSVVTSSL